MIWELADLISVGLNSLHMFSLHSDVAVGGLTAVVITCALHNGVLQQHIGSTPGMNVSVTGYIAMQGPVAPTKQ